MLFERAAVIGVGLIGGSFALALKQAKACAHVVGAGRTPANLKMALERGLIDSIAADAAAAVRGADLVLVSAPVGQFAKVFKEIFSNLNAKAVLTDAGSTKRDVIAAARAALGAKIAQFVPAHPIAGGEASGATAASADLFRGKRVILTPLSESSASAVGKITGAWELVGASVLSMAPEEHDAVLGTVSHLPHLLAYALAQDVATRANSERLHQIAGAGFRDFTRLASSSPEMWRDICIANRDALLLETAKFSAKLAEIRGLLEKGDAAALEKLFAEAREAREKWLKRSS